MMNLVSFETPPLARKDRANSAITATAATTRANEASSSSICFDSHLDLSLGISLSHGGSSCDATDCSKASYGDRQGSRGNKNFGGMTSDTTTITATTTTSALTAGLCDVSDDLTAASGWAAAFMPSPTGFMHPWSLAARQQKAAAEQDRAPPAAYVPSNDGRVIPLPSAIGWPPVHTSRRNITTATHVTKTGSATVVADGSKISTTTHGGEKNVVAPTDSTVVATRRPPANMFAKVHMEGHNIGRKINLRAHGSYDSLSRVLTKMTRNFFCPADCSNANTGEEDLPNSDKFIFLYEDFEGDRMLVGDVPWELFLASAKRLYIVQNPTSRAKGHGEGEGKNKMEEPTNNSRH